MTLQQLLEYIGQHPAWVIFFFCIIPFAAFLWGVLAKGEGHLPPWNYLYSAMIYLVAVPGIFAITLFIYQFLFENQSILDTRIFTQIIPVISMIVTILIIRKNVDLKEVPGFDKLSGLIIVITATLGIMWFIDRTRILVFSYLRIEWVILIFIALLLIIRFGWRRITGTKPDQ